MAYNDKDGRAGLRGYVQFNKHTHAHTHTQTHENESSSGDGNRDEDGNEDRIREGGREVNKRKKPHKSCRCHVGNGGDLVGKRIKCRK